MYSGFELEWPISPKNNINGIHKFVFEPTLLKPGYLIFIMSAWKPTCFQRHVTPKPNPKIQNVHLGKLYCKHTSRTESFLMHLISNWTALFKLSWIKSKCRFVIYIGGHELKIINFFLASKWIRKTERTNKKEQNGTECRTTNQRAANSTYSYSNRTNWKLHKFRFTKQTTKY